MYNAIYHCNDIYRSGVGLVLHAYGVGVDVSWYNLTTLILVFIGLIISVYHGVEMNTLRSIESRIQKLELKDGSN